MSSDNLYHVTDKDVAEFTPSIFIYEINLLVSVICFTLNVVNILVLSTTYKFRQQYSMFILLSISEMVSLIGIMLEATMRRQLFIEAKITRVAEKRTSRSCLLPWTLIQVTGDFWSPSLVVLMGIERMCAITFPTIFRNIFITNMYLILALTTFSSSLFVIVPTIINIIHPTPNVRWSCGRKAAFGTAFGIVDYAYNVIFYTFAFIFNLIAMKNALQVQQSRRNMAKLKCYTAISLLSTVLISIPNAVSIINIFVTVPDVIITPAPILACINSAIQFVVYLMFNPDYRAHFFSIIRLLLVKKTAQMPVLSVRLK